MEELEGQPAPEAPAAQEAQQPAIDPRLAMEIAAQQFGVTPDYVEGAIRLQDENRRVSEENRRRQRDLELREAQLEARSSERQRYEPSQSYQDMDPAAQRIMERLDKIDRRYDEERRERLENENKMEEARRIGDELNEHFQSVMRTLPTQQQMDPQRFFGSMRELWPNGPPEGISPDRAVNITAKYLGISTNGVGPSTFTPQPNNNPYRNPRASIVIPGGSTSSGQPSSMMNDRDSQRPGETLEQYSARLARYFEERSIKGIGDGVRTSSG